MGQSRESGEKKTEGYARPFINLPHAIYVHDLAGAYLPASLQIYRELKLLPADVYKTMR